MDHIGVRSCELVTYVDTIEHSALTLRNGPEFVEFLVQLGIPRAHLPGAAASHCGHDVAPVFAESDKFGAVDPAPVGPSDLADGIVELLRKIQPLGARGVMHEIRVVVWAKSDAEGRGAADAEPFAVLCVDPGGEGRGEATMFCGDEVERSPECRRAGVSHGSNLSRSCRGIRRSSYRWSRGPCGRLGRCRGSQRKQRTAGEVERS